MLQDVEMDKTKGHKFFVTGGAGFIGSNMVELLLKKGAKVIVYDNLSTGRYDFIKKFDGKDLTFIKGDMTDPEGLVRALKDTTPDAIVHYAADSSVNSADSNPMEIGIASIYNLLDAMVKNNVKNILFASSGSVYGNAGIKPTPEDYGPLKPISFYAATKLSSEAAISVFSSLYGINFYIFRYANVIGKNATHGAIFDFVNKLKKNKTELKVLGNGKQRKSCITVEDTVEATLYVYEKSSSRENIFNVASDDQISVKEIAEIVVNKAAKGAKITYGTTPEGWPGDIADNFISNKKLKELGYTPKYNSRQAVERTVDAVMQM